MDVSNELVSRWHRRAQRLGRAGQREQASTHVLDRPYNDRRYLLDDSKIRQQLGWAEKHTFEAGLDKTIAWYLEEHPDDAEIWTRAGSRLRLS